MKTTVAFAHPELCNPALLNRSSFGQNPRVSEFTSIDEAWDRSIIDHPDATIFHSSGWAAVLSETYGHKPLYLRVAAGESSHALLPLMEVSSSFTGRRGVSLPFSDFCAPLIFGEASSNNLIVDAVSQIARDRRWKYFELRFTPSVAASALAPNKTFYAHKLDLQKSGDDLFGGFDSAARRAIRKAERSGLTAEISHDEKAVDQFFALHSRTRRRHGIPPQPRTFFRNIHRHIIQRGLGFVALTYLNSKPIAAAIFFHFGKLGVYKFGASDEREQTHRPNNLLMWEGIKHCAQLGLKSLHLGRTDFGQEGLRRFKLSLGACEEVLRYFRFDPLAQRWLPEERAFSSNLPGAVFRRLPLTVNQLAGTVLYPHLH